MPGHGVMVSWSPQWDSELDNREIKAFDWDKWPSSARHGTWKGQTPGSCAPARESVEGQEEEGQNPVPSHNKKALRNKESKLRQSLHEAKAKEERDMKRRLTLQERWAKLGAEEHKLMGRMKIVRRDQKSCLETLKEIWKRIDLRAVQRINAEAELGAIREKKHQLASLDAKAREGDLVRQASENEAQLRVVSDSLSAANEALKSERDKVTELQSSVKKERALKEETAAMLESEKDKNLCIICMTRSRDVLVLPCDHFLYCKVCLEKYQETRNDCPMCRTVTSALLVCKVKCR